LKRTILLSSWRFSFSRPSDVLDPRAHDRLQGFAVCSDVASTAERHQRAILAQPFEEAFRIGDVERLWIGARLCAQVEDPRFLSCMAEQLLTYGVGRSFRTADGRAYADAVARHAAVGGKARWRSWIEVIVSTEAFRTRRGVAP
jgi:hypothetical protein